MVGRPGEVCQDEDKAVELAWLDEQGSETRAVLGGKGCRVESKIVKKDEGYEPMRRKPIHVDKGRVDDGEDRNPVELLKARTVQEKQGSSPRMIPIERC